MKKEILGILLCFLVLFTAVSLLTYSPADPSLHHASGASNVENFFGLSGAHIGGLLIGLFGMGAFWIPVLLLIACVRFYTGKNGHYIGFIAAGGLLLVVTTGALFALFGNVVHVFSTPYAAGGMAGDPLRSLLSDYANWTGALAILLVGFIVGFIMTTGISVVRVSKNALKLILSFARRIRTWMGRAVAFLKKAIRLPRRKPRPEKPPQPARKKTENTSKTAKPRKAEKPEKPPEKADAGDIRIKTSAPPLSVQSTPPPRQQVFESMQVQEGFQLPPLDFLEDPEQVTTEVDHEHLRQQSHLLEQKLQDFGVQGNVTEVLPGPVITRYEFSPAPGVKINKVVNLTDDLALALKAMSVRIIAPIPGKAVIGIELPNEHKETVALKDIVASSVYTKSASKLTIALGKDIVGHPVVADLATMPHLLIAGATGTGKSVALNTMITSLLCKATPDETKFIMIDPKRIELSTYDGIPHLIAPVVTDMKKATNALFWAVREMERRYQLLSEKRVRNISQYNKKIDKQKPAEGEEPPEKLPYIVLIIDELADLMMVSSRDVEVSLTRLAQMARAAGIHMIIATQRPSVDVLTGLIKANFPTRMSFQVSSKTDSRTIMDTNGAETLLGNGDMLFLPPGTAKLQRIHGAYVSEEEVNKIIEFLKAQDTPDYDHEVVEAAAPEKGGGDEEDYDERYDEAVQLVAKTGQASISKVQRHLRVGYNRAARIIELMEKEGVVGPSDGVKPREVLVKNDYDDMP
ncbi:MAG: DNA translocase FtsK [Thermodesulfobacteriota bacterium]